MNSDDSSSEFDFDDDINDKTYLPDDCATDSENETRITTNSKRKCKRPATSQASEIPKRVKKNGVEDYENVPVQEKTIPAEKSTVKPKIEIGNKLLLKSNRFVDIFDLHCIFFYNSFLFCDFRARNIAN